MMLEDKYNLDTLISDIEEISMSNLGTHITNSLYANDIVTFGDIMSFEKRDFLKLGNIGKKSLRIISEFQVKYRELYERIIKKSTYCSVLQEDSIELRRFTLAKDVMLVLIDKDFGSSENIQSVIKEAGDMYEFHSTLAVKYADALINKLKEIKTEE